MLYYLSRAPLFHQLVEFQEICLRIPFDWQEVTPTLQFEAMKQVKRCVTTLINMEWYWCVSIQKMHCLLHICHLKTRTFHLPLTSHFMPFYSQCFTDNNFGTLISDHLIKAGCLINCCAVNTSNGN